MDILTPERVQREEELRAPEQPLLWSVWIDTNCGHCAVPDWWENSPAKLLGDALKEAEECRHDGFPTKLLPEGEKPSSNALRYGHPYLG